MNIKPISKKWGAEAVVGYLDNPVQGQKYLGSIANSPIFHWRRSTSIRNNDLIDFEDVDLKEIALANIATNSPAPHKFEFPF